MRMPLTVVFCDLVGSSAMAQALDPEQVMEVVVAFFDHCTTIIEQAGGIVARYMGDGVLAYFGYPELREHDAERAVRAARTIVDTIGAVQSVAPTPLSARVGIATGATVTGLRIGAGSAAEILTVGGAANIASRLQTASEANQITVDEETRRQTQAIFNFSPLPPMPLKGIDDHFQAYACLDAKPPLLFSGTKQAITGRKSEFKAALQFLFGNESSTQKLLLVPGEAGMGKTTLLEGMCAAASEAGYPVIKISGSEIHADSAFHAIRSPTALDKIKHAPADPRSLQAFVPERFFRSFARNSRLLIAMEDVHWIDPSSLSQLEEFQKSATDLQLALVATSRQNLDQFLPGLGNRLTLELKAVKAREVAAIIMAQFPELDTEALEQIAESAGGNPFFACELARHHAEGAARGHLPSLPTSLNQVLLARLSRAGRAIESAQIVSVLGNRASLEAIKALSPIPTEMVRNDLDQLVDRGILVQDEAPGTGIHFGFAHALLRAAAYESMLIGKRKALHGHAAQILLAEAAVPSGPPHSIIARHWEAAGEDVRAQAAWHDAARVALSSNAYVEAQRAYENALSLLRNRTPDFAASGEEIILQSGLGTVLQVTQGYSSPAAMNAMAKARALAQEGNGGADAFTNLVGLWSGASSAGDYGQSRKLMDQILPLALAMGNDLSLAVAHMIQLTTLYRVGDLDKADQMFRNGERYFGCSQFMSHPGSIAQSYGNGALIACLRGQKRETNRRLKRVLAQANAEEHPYVRCFAASMAATVLRLQGKYEAALGEAGVALQLATENNYPQFQAMAQIVTGSSKSLIGNARTAVHMIEKGLAAMELSRSKAGMTMYRGWLAEALIEAGRPQRAISLIDQTFESYPDEIFYNAELISTRRKAEELRRSGVSKKT